MTSSAISRANAAGPTGLDRCPGSAPRRDSRFGGLRARRRSPARRASSRLPTLLALPSGDRGIWAPDIRRRPIAGGVAGGDPASVDVDLVVDELEVLLHLGQLGGDVGAVGLHELEPFLLVAVPGGYELGVAADGLDGHAGGPQLGADDDPVQVLLP